MELDLMGAQEGQAGRGGTEPAGDYTFLYGNWNINRQLGTEFFVHKGIISLVKRVEFASHKTQIIL
jgi:hypothetical protein